MIPLNQFNWQATLSGLQLYLNWRVFCLKFFANNGQADVRVCSYLKFGKNILDSLVLKSN